LWIAHDPTDDFVTIAYVVIVIPAAAAHVGADKVKVVSVMLSAAQ
jgi:hypothetical protein